ncbi:bifunctional phosphopantothenoylcysteine decarboxylase/phosphopantothenate--cysteine ligase CoaBC [Marinoscillum sp. MHG1-6]|uniref:bifunctional phosphopantothenoylcysteine decarboxylase/phosphopantothenate--cysteine ligase CoaBC n=1 Tax=Marinoscillum sp. MHG1-6 TaxID=2959627 RepID=UPI002157C1FA|nr:bifunctional phosphopantothenoylcysteine decarboxylase/phosphopantothenate--cysteine ligase CoaBC [Marinoscillum sp. MHG1-6]
MLAGKKILLAVCGSIAAYKAAFFVRLLIKEGAEVQVVMTESSKGFITPLTLSTLSKKPALSEFVKNNAGEWNNHVDLALWADLMVVAPLSANTLGKMATGRCDNLVLATYLSAKCPVMVCPAMDLDMYLHDSTKQNLEILRGFGNIVIEAQSGELASGLHGEGRLTEPEDILESIKDHFKKAHSFEGKTVLITSGPTQEAIDPVRFIGNHSTGKMGKAIAIEMASRGAQVTFVSGPVTLYPIHPNIQVKKVSSAVEMFTAANAAYSTSDIAIFTAAVADFRPEVVADSKIKKQKEEGITINLIQNPDIARELGQQKTRQFNVGFALETDNEAVNAQNKLKSKNFDLIVLNSLRQEGAGFAHDTNKVTIFDKDNKEYHFELKRKEEVASDLAEIIYSKTNA